MVNISNIRRILLFQSLLFLIGFPHLSERMNIENKQGTSSKLAEISDLTNTNKSSGHILYIEKNYDKRTNQWSRDLWVMDGNGNDKHLIIKNVSSSADWSADGKKIAVGIYDENGDEKLIVLDAPKTLDSCLGEVETITCQPVILGEYPLSEESGLSSIYIVSWFADGKKILVSSECILDTEKPENWDCFFDGFAPYTDVSPLTDEIIMSGLWTYSLETDLLSKLGQVYGRDPEWAPDGRKAAFLYYQSEIGSLSYQTNESKGIMQIRFTENGLEYAVLYSPRPDDEENPFYNFDLSWGEFRRLSWSPDGRYLAFSAEHGNHSLIYRLDTLTGEIYLLTEITSEDSLREFSSPAWGPR